MNEKVLSSLPPFCLRFFVHPHAALRVTVKNPQKREMYDLYIIYHASCLYDILHIINIQFNSLYTLKIYIYTSIIYTYNYICNYIYIDNYIMYISSQIPPIHNNPFITTRHRVPPPRFCWSHLWPSVKTIEVDPSEYLCHGEQTPCSSTGAVECLGSEEENIKAFSIVSMVNW